MNMLKKIKFLVMVVNCKIVIIIDALKKNTNDGKTPLFRSVYETILMKVGHVSVCGRLWRGWWTLNGG